MASLEYINDEYVFLKKADGVFQDCLLKINEILNNSFDDPYRYSSIVDILISLSESVDCSDNKPFSDLITLSIKYKQYQDLINEYDVFLTKNIQSSISRKDSTLKNLLKRISDKHDEIVSSRDVFNSSYGVLVSSYEEMIHAIVLFLNKEVESINIRNEELKNQATEVIRNSDSTELSIDMPLEDSDILPMQICIGQLASHSTPLEIVRDIGLTNLSRQYVYNDLKNQGNIIIKTDYSSINDREIDAFLLAYITRYIEAFPLGSVNVHIFSKNASFLYKRMCNCFQTDNAGELTKRIIQIHSDIGDLSAFRDVICEDIFKKTSLSVRDLFDIYETDRTDVFNLIVLRDGLVDGNGYAASEVLNIVDSLTETGESGHRCGIRFLIVDSSDSFESRLSDGAITSLNSIERNCGIPLEYNEKSFSIDGENVSVLSVGDDIEAFAQERSRLIAEAINNKEQNRISISEVMAYEYSGGVEAIINIPVGKSGNNIVELPFSCKDVNDTVAGQCIGYMAIGQSGSGKSSFFHSLVLNGCMKYSPVDLQFWLLDFKNGGASSKYRDSGLPHIKMIAEDNKIDDAFCLFQMVLEEMERRNKVFNDNHVDNIIDYNEIAVSKGLEHFPRIIIAIDEVQEIFREDSASVIKDKISRISTRMRSSGMHFVMVAQNLCDGKSYMLKEAFLPSAKGRICFRVAADIPRDSAFEDDFVQRKQEITSLKTGEAYVGYGKDTIKKVKMAYASPEEMHSKYFGEIRNKYPQYAMMKPLIIGSKQRLSINNRLQGKQETFLDIFRNNISTNGICKAVIGEDGYRMSPLGVQFTQNENSSVLLLGSDKQISSSLCTSISLSLMRQNVPIHLFNGDRTRVQIGEESHYHAFMYLSQCVGEGSSKIRNHRMNELKEVLRELYIEYLSRQSRVQEAEYEDPLFEPIFLIINDLFAIESFVNNEMIEGGGEHGTSTPPGNPDNLFNYDLGSAIMGGDSDNSIFREGIQSILGTIVKSGWRYNIHTILAIKGDPSTWRGTRITSEINNVVLFNSTDYTDQFENSYYLREMLKNISNDGEAETMAIWYSHKTYSKIRPFVYVMSDEREKQTIDLLVKECLR